MQPENNASITVNYQRLAKIMLMLRNDPFGAMRDGYDKEIIREHPSFGGGGMSLRLCRKDPA